MCEMNHMFDLNIKFVREEDNTGNGLESPISDTEMLYWEQPSKDLDQATLSPETREGHDINPGLLKEKTETGRSDFSQKKVDYSHIPSNNEQKPGKSRSISDLTRGRCCSRSCSKPVCIVVTFAIIVTVLLAVGLTHHPIESSQSSVQALAGEVQIDADQGKWIQGLCWKEHASCKAPYCHYTCIDIPVLESLHQIQTPIINCHINKEECKLTYCSKYVGCLNSCDEIKAEVVNKTYDCDDSLKCCHALSLAKECLNRTDTNHIASSFCSDGEALKMPKVQCDLGWVGDSCDQTKSKKVKCKCYKSWSNSLCVNSPDCSEMAYVENRSSLCRKNNLTHCLDESKVCKSQSEERDELCLCDFNVDEAFGSSKYDIKEETGPDTNPDIKDLCWRTNVPCKIPYCSKINLANPVPVLERLYENDKSHASCKKRDDDNSECALMVCKEHDRCPNTYDELEDHLKKQECDNTIKCCDVKYYGQKFFNVSTNGNSQIISLFCKDYESTEAPEFQCRQGWRGKRCNEANQRSIVCKCFQPYSLCEAKTNCSEMMYLEEKKCLCLKHNVTHCLQESRVCSSQIQGKQCLCDVDIHLAEDMKGQRALTNGGTSIEPLTSTSTRNSIVFWISLCLVRLRPSR